uniref:PAN domain protein n=1 Tax=Parastrongyloides trichosuri TaxID=131310 RepID=A0A0N4ZHI4_PARTI
MIKDKFIIFLLFIFLLKSQVFANSAYVKCFQRTVRRSIDNYQPIMELFYVTPYNCIEQCVSLTGNNQDENSDCKSFVFNHFQHSCRLYNHDGNQAPAVIHPANGYDFFRRTAFSGPCTPTTVYKLQSEGILNSNIYNSQTAAQFNEYQKSHGLQNKIQRPMINEKLKTNLKEPMPIVAASSHSLRSDIPLSIDTHTLSSTETKTKVQENFNEEEKDMPMKQAEIFYSNEPKPGSTGGLFKASNEIHSPPNSAKDLGYVSSNEKSKEIILETTTNSQSEDNIDTKSVKSNSKEILHKKIESKHSKEVNNGNENEKNCPSSIGYYVVIGNQIILPMQSNNKDVFSVQGIEQAKCAALCSAGQGPRGEKISCSSINYFPISKTCEMYNILAEPHGSGSLIENDDVIYSEKFCLPPSVTECQNDEIFILHVQKNLNLSVIEVVPSNSITSCLAECLNKKKCKASTFNSENSTCTLSSADIGENPDILKEGDAGTVVIENGCNMRLRKAKLRGSKTYSTKNKIIDDSTIQTDLQWTSWSDCRYKIAGRNVRIRTRHCDINCADGGLQLEKC